MNVYVEASFDTSVGVSPGESLVQWFRMARARLFDDLVKAEARGDEGVFSRGTVRQDIDDSSHDLENVGSNWENFEQFLAAFPWRAGVHYFSRDGELSELGWARALHVLTDGSLWRTSAAVTVTSPDHAGSCARLVDFLHGALDTVNPAFGRIELDNFNEVTNLDAALGRRKRTSLRESRELLRGYAWVTVCPAELSARLGGVTELEASGAFHRVIPLRAGGVLLQASETLAGYTDEVMQRVFEALAPVLPDGEPRPDPAYPYMRFVPRDAANVR
ncbi:hypothetical protein ABZ848_00385 [Streptomyces sp. NPDC047081]|uniref:hypothetical protein n=1 Tax=Streptomyces sp. NPDC047081 TaxID=3154706 RepID=UPI0033F95B28